MQDKSPQPEVSEQFAKAPLGIADLETYAALLLSVVITAVLATVATFRSWGFDYVDGGIKDLYPFVANGWGLWYWLAKLKLDFYSFSFLLNMVLSSQIVSLSLPYRLKLRLIPLPLIFFTYMVFWFLFGQARYGMAVGLIAAGAIVGSYPAVILLGLIATLIHKAAGGVMLLILLWIFLKERRHGLITALASSAVLSFVVVEGFKKILLMTGYGDYLNWGSLPGAETPLKFYYLIGVLALWKILDRKMSDQYLILTFLFLPFSYVVVFAGRAFEMYVVILLALLCREEAPWYVRYSIALLLLVDVSMLLFTSGFFF